MNGCEKIRWAPFYLFFGAQRLLWWILLRVLIPDCKSLVDANIIAKEGIAEKGSAKKVLDEIYKFLGILDSKASALMRYNGIILAVIALMRRQDQSLPNVTHYIVGLTIGSILACLLVVGIFWRFLEWVEPRGADEDAKLSKELKLIRRVLVLREVAYQVAWWLSFAVLIILWMNLSEFFTPLKAIVTPPPANSG
jgi:hypothetical protein